MIWVAQRRFRISVIAVLMAMSLLFVIMAFSGIQLLHDYDTRAATCTARMDCTWVQRYFSTFRALGHVWSSLLLVAPALAGILWGSMVAHDIATAANDSPDARAVRRWVARRLAVVTCVVLVLIGMLSVAVTWWQSPLDRFYADPFSSFDTRGFVPVAYAALAVVLGAVLGVVVRRRSLAVVATLAVFAAVRAGIDYLVRPHLFPRLVASRPFHVPGLGGGRVVTRLAVQRGAWVFGDRVTTASGRVLTTPFGIGRHGLYGIRVHKGIASVPGVGPCHGRIHGASAQLPWHPNPEARLALQRCVDTLHLRELVSYLPTSRYWLLQGAESAIYIVLAIALGVFCVRRASRADPRP